MKVLIVCSGNYENFDFQKNQAFIYDQLKSIEKAEPGITFQTFFVKGKGLKGYLKNIPAIKKLISSTKPDIIHAHGGLLGLLCCFQRKVPLVCTLHGSDVNLPVLNLFSSIVGLFANKLIFVSEKLMEKSYLKFPRKSFLIPCGVDIEIFYPHKTNENQVRQTIRKVLFASDFNNPVKNYSLASEALKNVEPQVEVIELKGKTRQEVSEILNTVDILLLTSFTEGSPQVIKEAMACNCPVVSTDVGDIRMVIGYTDGCYMCSYDTEDVAEKIQKGLDFARRNGRTNGRQRITELGLDSVTIGKKIIGIYNKVLNG